MNKVKNIGLNGVARRKANGFAYVYIPNNVDRDEYIKNCLNTNTVSLVTENGEYFHKVPVGKLAIQMIQFPEDETQTGSPVIWANIPPQNQIVVTDVYEFRDEFQSLGENQFKITKQKDGANAGLSIRGKNGQILLTAGGSTTEDGRLEINISNQFATALLKTLVKGEIQITGTSDIDIKTFKEVHIQAVDEDNQTLSEIICNIDDIEMKAVKDIEVESGEKFQVTVGGETIIDAAKSITIDTIEDFVATILGATTINSNGLLTLQSGQNNVQISGKEIKHNDGTEPMVLGDTLADVLDDILTQISSITVVTALGTQPIINKPLVEQLKTTLDTIKSSTSKLS